MPARLFAIGDIHGCDVALDTLLKTLAPGADDTIVVLGDVVDRGAGSKRAVDRLLSLRDECRLILLQGNHEQMMLEALRDGLGAEDWLRFGGMETLLSYGGDPRKVPPEHLDFMASGLPYWETESELFIHANLQPGVPLEQQLAEWLRWTHLKGIEQPHPSGKRVICGHTPQRSGEPLVLPGWVCIDTFACGGGWLTGLNVATNDYLQANQAGEQRQGRLRSPRD